jgi:hypothetical protein
MPKLLLSTVLLALPALFIGQPAHCSFGYCPTYRCYAPCGYDCTCVQAPGASGGECWGIDRAQQLEREGWTRLR